MSKVDFMQEQIGFKEVNEILEQQLFWSEYEPVVDVKTNTIFGYEALARFHYKRRAYSPAPILEMAHHCQTLFYRLERALKIHQIKHRPSEGVLFVNIDPHNFNTKEKIDFWEDLFCQHEEMCIEVTENTNGLESNLLVNALPHLKKTGAFIAQDDIGNDEKLFCFDLMHHAHILKFDRSWFQKIALCTDYVHILKGFILFARKQGKKSVMEGIETELDLKIARELEVDFVQGYYFKSYNQRSIDAKR